MAYTAYLNNDIFFSTEVDLEELTLTSAKVSSELNKAPGFTFTAPEQNVAYGTFSQLTDIIEVYRDGEGDPIYSGRVLDIKKDFYNRETVICEGLLAWLNDSIVRPFTYNGSLLGLVTEFLNQHTTQMSSKAIYPGTITVTDEYLYRAFEGYKTTWERLKDLIDSYGGYMSLRKSGAVYLLDWLSDLTDVAEQSVEFGQNELDLTQESAGDKIKTVVIPLGAEITDAEGNKSKLTIKSVNDGKDFLEDTEASGTFGRVVTVVNYDNVTTPAALKAKGQEYLNDIVRSRVTIKLSAVDLADAGEDIEHFHVGDVIRIKSDCHGIDRNMLCKSLSIDLLNPASNKLVLGDTIVGYIASQASKTQRTADTVDRIITNYAANTQVDALKDAQAADHSAIIEQASMIAQTGQQINAVVSQLSTYDGRINSMESQLRQTAEMLAVYFGTGGTINTWFEFTENFFKIGKATSPIHSEQDNQSYRFVDLGGNKLLLIDGSTKEIRTTTLSAVAQVKISAGSVDAPTNQWAIRKGKVIAGKGVNLDIVWIGG